MQAATSCLLLGGAAILQAHAASLAALLAGLIGHVNDRGMLLLLPVMTLALQISPAGMPPGAPDPGALGLLLGSWRHCAALPAAWSTSMACLKTARVRRGGRCHECLRASLSPGMVCRRAAAAGPSACAADHGHAAAAGNGSCGGGCAPLPVPTHISCLAAAHLHRRLTEPFSGLCAGAAPLLPSHSM